MYFWSKENKIISFGTADEKDKTIRMNQTKKIMDFTGKEISSIEELKSKLESDYESLWRRIRFQESHRDRTPVFFKIHQVLYD